MNDVCKQGLSGKEQVRCSIFTKFGNHLSFQAKMSILPLTSVRIPIGHWSICRYRVRYLEASEDVYRNPGWHRSCHRYWALDTGPMNGRVKINGQVYSRDENSVALYAPNTVYEEKLEVGRLICWSWLLIEETGKPSILRTLTGKQGFCILSDPGQVIRQKIQELAHVAQNGSSERSFFLHSLLYHILGALVQLHAQEHIPVRIPHAVLRVHPWRQAVWQMLDKRTDEKFSSQRLADKLGVSLSALTHQYRACCGESLSETVRQWRMEKARALFNQGTLSMKEIAATIGLAHQTYFSKLFKEATSYSPSQYRKLLQSQKKDIKKQGVSSKA